MSVRSLVLLLLLLPLTFGGDLPTSDAAPIDAKVGETRVTWKRAGTPLLATPDAMGKAVTLIPKATKVVVVEVKLPWVRVKHGQLTGWVTAREIVEITSLRKNPLPMHQTDRGSRKVNAKDTAAAGRQFDEATERQYRVTRADLKRGYMLVDQMEKMTQDLQPIDSMEFIVDGYLGRRGRDYALPGRLPRAKPRRSSGGNPVSRGTAGKIGRFLGGEIGKRVGGSKGARLGGMAGEALGKALHAWRDMADQINTKFLPQQEYYLGRAVMAETLARTPFAPEMHLRMYVKRLGDAIVRLSNRIPANFGGYHFDVIDSDEVNGVSGPGGFVLITRGAILACETEDELAAILCHELAHSTKQHAEKILRRGKIMSRRHKSFMSLLGSVKSEKDPRIQREMTGWFGDSVGDMRATAAQRGYGKQLEFEADLEGTNILFEVYYDHFAMRDLLRRMAATGKANRQGGTHAPPAVRAQWLGARIANYKPFNPREGVRESRQERFTTTAAR